MKILLLNNFHYRRGGSEAVYFNTGELLERKGHEVAYFSLKHPDNITSEYSEYFANRRMHVKGALAASKLYMYNKSAEYELERLLQKFRPDVAHVHLIWGGLTVSVLKVLKRYNIPVVHTAHDYRMICPSYLFMDGKKHICEACRGHKFYNAIFRRCAKGSLSQSCLMAAEAYVRNLRYKAYELIDYTVYVSKFSRNLHVNYNKVLRRKPSGVLYNFCPDLSEYVSDSDGTYTYIGRLSNEKGIYTLIKAFESVKNLQLRIVGTGPLEAELKQYCKENRVENVEFVGYKTGADLYRIVANSKFVCVPSEWYENNPMSVIESMSMGVPVIGAKIGGIPEIIEEGKTGYTFASASVDDLIRVLRQSEVVQADDYKQMKQYAQSYAKNNFEAGLYYEKLMNIYQSVINNKLK